MIPHEPPKVLLLGNGLLRLGSGWSWNQLLSGIGGKNYTDEELDGVPFCMQPELYCDAGAEKIRKEAAKKIGESITLTPQLKRLLSLDFDCIITTNYTYEAEHILTGGKWNDARRRKALRVCDGSPRVQNNVSICYEFKRDGRQPLQVWHIHGDAMRHSTLILSYYSYTKQMHKLQTYNELLKDDIEQAQNTGKDLPVRSWLDWFLTGDVYTVGYGFDFAEIDMWWALERKKRSHAKVGTLHHCCIEEEGAKPHIRMMMEAMGGEYRAFRKEKDMSWGQMYDRVIDEVEKEIER